jgi:SAM-dependent methyltransferase
MAIRNTKNNFFIKIYERMKNPPSSKSRVQRIEIPRFINGLKENSKILNIGSKNTVYSKPVINLDIVRYPNIDVMADAHNLPFGDNTIDAVIITAVLEIVKYPIKVVSEINRVLKKEGIVVATLPFLQPYHPDPTDCQRFTREGVENLFFQFEKIKLCNTRGLFSMLIRILRDFCAILFSFNNITLWKILNIVFGWLFFPLGYIDYILPEYKQLHFISSSFLYIGRKK